MKYIEANIDGLVGPSHHFGGLGVGNVASKSHQYQTSHPKAAALQGLEKAWFVASIGVPQFVFPPPLRPNVEFLDKLGLASDFENPAKPDDTDMLAMSAAWSSAFMWAANAATVSCSADTRDGKLHVTPANLISSWHRGLEAAERAENFHLLLSDLIEPDEQQKQAVLHAALPAIVPLRDEGAANHMRLSDRDGKLGLNVFVYGSERSPDRGKFPARQTLASVQALARSHGLAAERTFFLEQHPTAIAAGVFHNDVIATSHENILLHHQLAFADGNEHKLHALESSFKLHAGSALQRRVITDDELPLADAVTSYFFNSQILTLPVAEPNVRQQMAMICPQQCQTVASAKKLVDSLLEDPQLPITQVHFMALDESMAGGGGPACLRLRLPVSELELTQLNRNYRLTDSRYEQLRNAIESTYPKRIELSDLCNNDLVASVARATDAVAACFR